MKRRIGILATALTLLAIPQLVGAQTQVGPDYFQQPTRTLVNFDTDPGNNPIASGDLLQNVYSAYGITFDANDRAIAFDDFEWADLFSPRLTVIRQPTTELGSRAVELLLSRLEHPDRPPRTERLEATFVHRDSCGCAQRSDLR